MACRVMRRSRVVRGVVWRRLLRVVPRVVRSRVRRLVRWRGVHVALVRGAPSQPKAGEEKSGSPTCLTHSFVGSTGVLMADGSNKAISLVKVGDRVPNTVPGSVVGQVHTVQKVIVMTTDHDFVDMTVKPTLAARAKSAAPKLGKAVASVAVTAAAVTALATPAQASTITTTYHHPFYDVTQSAFVDADQLKPGDELQSTGGAAVGIVGVRLFHTTTTTYDLTIDGLHTYYVVAGTTPILVHNCAAGGRTKGLRPNLDAEGPHVTFRRDASTGKVSHYAEWTEQTNPRNPAPWEQTKRVDMQGVFHYDKVTGDSISTSVIQKW